MKLVIVMTLVLAAEIVCCIWSTIYNCKSRDKNSAAVYMLYRELEKFNDNKNENIERECKEE